MYVVGFVNWHCINNSNQKHIFNTRSLWSQEN